MLEGAVAQAKTSNSPPSSSPPLFSLPQPTVSLVRTGKLVLSLIQVSNTSSSVMQVLPLVSCAILDIGVDPK